MKYKIAIPSYKRPEILKKYTLRALEEMKVPPKRVRIFVANNAERKAYREVIGAEWAARLVVAQRGMRAVRNYICDYYPEGTKVVSVDDDIRDVCYKVNDKKFERVKRFDDVAERGFEAVEKAGLRLWGVYPLLNPLFMKLTTTTDLRYIGGGLWGVINTHDRSTYVQLDDKEDFERTLRFYDADGGVVRLNYIAFNTTAYGYAGGMQEERTEKRITWSAKQLLQWFPMYCELNPNRKRHTEVRLRDRTRGVR